MGQSSSREAATRANSFGGSHRTDESKRMPREGKALSAAQIEALRRWIDHGATSPADEPVLRRRRNTGRFRRCADRKCRS